MAILSALLALQPLPAGQDQDACAQPGACRRVETVRIQMPDGSPKELHVNDKLPWVVQDNILLTPGESVTIRLEKAGDALVPKLVRTGPASAATPPADGEIRFEFGAFDKGNVILTAESKWPEPLDYAALMVTEPGGPQRTSVCTLRPGIAVFEAWRAPIRQLALWSFRATKEPGCKTVAFPKQD